MHTGVAFSPDGRTLAYTSANHTVVLWDVASRRATARLSGHTQPVRAVAFSPDGHSLATAGTDESVILWGMDAAATAADICRTLARDLTPEQWGHFLPDVAYERTCTG
jgi:WD40 repeat protein